ncbi:5269_t:CDS:2, partial [Rhizophagus irregularis]
DYQHYWQGCPGTESLVLDAFLVDAAVAVPFEHKRDADPVWRSTYKRDADV